MLIHAWLATLRGTTLSVEIMLQSNTNVESKLKKKHMPSAYYKVRTCGAQGIMIQRRLMLSSILVTVKTVPWQGLLYHAGVSFGR